MDTILLVDDEPSIAVLLGEAIKKFGYTPIVVQNSKDVMPAFEKHKPVLAIIDYMLPGINGGQLFEKIRATTEGAGMPVIFITAIPVRQVENTVKDHTLVRFMQKPLDFIEMQKTIQTLLIDRANRSAARP